MFMDTPISLISLPPFLELFLFHLADVCRVSSFCHSISVSSLPCLALCLNRLIFMNYIKGLPCPLDFGEFHTWEA